MLYDSKRCCILPEIRAVYLPKRTWNGGTIQCGKFHISHRTYKMKRKKKTSENKSRDCRFLKEKNKHAKQRLKWGVIE